MPLWKATMEIEVEVFIVSADPPDEAEVRRFAKLEFAENGMDCFGWMRGPTQITDPAEIPEEWEDSLPYGYNPTDQVTCAEILKGTK